MKIKGVSPVLWGGIITVIVAAAVLGYLQQMKTDPVVAEEEEVVASASPSATPTATATPLAEPTPITDAGVSWNSPTKVDSLALIKAVDGAEVTYYKVGTYNDRDIILALANSNGINIYPMNILFIKNEGKNTYSVLSKYNKEDVDYISNEGKDMGLSWGEGVTVNTTLSLQSVALQSQLSIKSTTLNVNRAAGLFSSHSENKNYKVEKLATTAYGPVYLQKRTLDDQSLLETLILHRFDGTAVLYDIPLGGVLDDAMVAQITWNDRTKNKDTYRYDGGGSCGVSSGVNVAPSVSGDLLTQTGTTTGGKAIYEFKDSNHVIVKGWYSQLTDGKYYDSVAGKEVSISFQDFVKKHPVILTQDSLDRYIILRNTVYGPNAECGKPVVYLYPEKATQVSVSVGAKITVSEPEYGQGWNVLAQPNGRLTTSDGKVWPNLFWEGQGNGAYPPITSGTVVKQSEVVPTLKQQMTQLGLTKQEQADFLEFWQEKLPTSPYTRLTWFGTREMDRLAPLAITPAPDTSIRVFLDFEGLQNPIELPAQKLTTTKRTGFTVVEWGGLLRR